MKKVLLCVLTAVLLLSMIACAEPIDEFDGENKISDVSGAQLSGIVEEQNELITNETPETSETPEIEQPAEEIGPITDDEIIINNDYSSLEDVAPSVYPSIMALRDAVLSKDDDEDGNYDINGIADIRTFYIPVIEKEAYVFHHVEVLADRMDFYYIPENEAETLWCLTDYIRVCVDLDSINEADPLVGYEERNRVARDADGFVYLEKASYGSTNAKIGFCVDGYLVVIWAPESMNDYATMRSLCKMQKVVIDPDAVIK